jgi:hypothetical protein
MTGAAETGAGELLRPGEGGPAGVAADDGRPVPAPADALCWAALPQAHSTPVSASPVSAALTGIRFSITAPACRELLAPWTRHPPAWLPSVADRSQTAWLPRELARVSGGTLAQADPPAAMTAHRPD